MLSIFLLLPCVSGWSQNTVTSKTIVQQEIIFPFQDEHTHGSSIVQLPNGDILAAWFQGSGDEDICVQDEGAVHAECFWRLSALLAF